jgi:hypothetical protein
LGLLLGLLFIVAVHDFRAGAARVRPCVHVVHGGGGDEDLYVKVGGGAGEDGCCKMKRMNEIICDSCLGWGNLHFQVDVFLKNVDQASKDLD